MPTPRLCLRLLCPHLLLLLSLLLFSGLSGCGPASSDNASGVESHASVSKPPLSEQRPAPDINPPTSATPVANPGPLASENRAGAVDDLGMSGWMEELASPNVPLETGEQLEPTGDDVGSLTQTLNDEEVVAKELIEEQESQGGDEGQEHQPHDEAG